MKKYLAIGIAVIVLIAIVGTFDKLLIATMHLVDTYGSATGTTTIEVITNEKVSNSEASLPVFLS